MRSPRDLVILVMSNKISKISRWRFKALEAESAVEAKSYRHMTNHLSMIALVECNLRTNVE